MVLLIRATEASLSRHGSEESGGSGGNTGAKLEDLDVAKLAKCTIGRHGPLLVDGSIVVLNFGAVCSYVVLVGGLSTTLLSEWSEESQVPRDPDDEHA